MQLKLPVGSFTLLQGDVAEEINQLLGIFSFVICLLLLMKPALI